MRNIMADPNGLRLCAKYAYAPNSLHYCGPEKQSDMAAYVARQIVDAGLAEILGKFETLYPYLRLIASSNHIDDPFDTRVVNAYWLGNPLLNNVKTRAFGDHLAYTLQLKKKLKAADFSSIMDQSIQGVPNHTFHVMNIYIRTGHHAIIHTLKTMDACRISWGIIMNNELGNMNGEYMVRTRPLVYNSNKICLGEPVIKKVTHIGVPLTVGDWVSLHWGVVCDVLTPQEKKQLMQITDSAMNLANTSV